MPSCPLFRTARTRVDLYEDASQRQRLAADPEVLRFMHWGEAAAFPAQVAAMQGRTPIDRAGWMNLAVTLEDGSRDGVYVGDHALNVGPEAALLGVALLPERRGQGLAREVILGSMAWLGANGVRAFRAEIDEGNVASRRLFEGLGFRLVEVTADETGPYRILALP
jgi:RimJ/RimL family protein N-acetyltransferase